MSVPRNVNGFELFHLYPGNPSSDERFNCSACAGRQRTRQVLRAAGSDQAEINQVVVSIQAAAGIAFVAAVDAARR